MCHVEQRESAFRTCRVGGRGVYMGTDRIWWLRGNMKRFVVKVRASRVRRRRVDWYSRETRRGRRGRKAERIVVFSAYTGGRRREFRRNCRRVRMIGGE